jgi:hypothetical protein
MEIEKKQETFKKEYGVEIPFESAFDCRICKKERIHVLRDAQMHEWGYWVERRCKTCGNQGVIIHI